MYSERLTNLNRRQRIQENKVETITVWYILIHKINKILHWGGKQIPFCQTCAGCILDELISWARMKVKAVKSRSLSIRKGVPQDKIIFGGEPIPQLAEKPLQSLGTQYSADLSDRQMGKQAKRQLAEGLAKIDQSQLPGKHKVCCYQHTLHQQVMWPLKICEIPMIPMRSAGWTA